MFLCDKRHRDVAVPGFKRVQVSKEVIYLPFTEAVQLQLLVNLNTMATRRLYTVLQRLKWFLMRYANALGSFRVACRPLALTVIGAERRGVRGPAPGLCVNPHRCLRCVQCCTAIQSVQRADVTCVSCHPPVQIWPWED